jgi:RNA-binding protein YlmH
VRSYSYLITIVGGLGEIGREAFGDFRIESNGINTVLAAELDQAALHAALNRIMALAIELVELRRLPDSLHEAGRRSGR